VGKHTFPRPLFTFSTCSAYHWPTAYINPDILCQASLFSFPLSRHRSNIDITNLDFSLSRLQVVEALAEVLYHDPFRPSPEHTRHVHLYKATKNPVHNNNGRGLLTLPSVEMGEAFLHLYGSSNPSKPLTIGSRVTKFLVSKKRLEPDIVGKISLVPFSDIPREEGKRDQWHKNTILWN
jgi:hypothetical protein